MLKMMYLTTRKSSLSPDQFRRRWRQHGALAMSFDNWRFVEGYVQAEPLDRQAIPGASEKYDALALFYASGAVLSSQEEGDRLAAERMMEDEKETFEVLTLQASLWAAEERVKPGPLGGFGLYYFSEVDDGAAEIARLAATFDQVHRVTINTPDPGMPDAANTLPYRCAIEVATNTPDNAAIVARKLNAAFEKPFELIATREIVFWDKLPR